MVVVVAGELKGRSGEEREGGGTELAIERKEGHDGMMSFSATQHAMPVVKMDEI